MFRQKCGERHNVGIWGHYLTHFRTINHLYRCTLVLIAFICIFNMINILYCLKPWYSYTIYIGLLADYIPSDAKTSLAIQKELKLFMLHEMLTSSSTEQRPCDSQEVPLTLTHWLMLKDLRQNPIGNRAISVFGGQISCTRIMISTWKSFMHFLKAKERNNCLK